MHIAASRGHLECVNCLIEAKAELDAPTALSAGGNTPLHLGMKENRSKKFFVSDQSTFFFYRLEKIHYYRGKRTHCTLIGNDKQFLACKMKVLEHFQ